MASWDRRSVIRSDIADVTAAVAAATDEKSAQHIGEYLLAQTARRPRPVSEALLAQIREIERWAERQTLVDRTRPDAQAKNRI